MSNNPDKIYDNSIKNAILNEIIPFAYHIQSNGSERNFL